MQRVNDPDLIAVARKKGLEREVIHGERESLDQRSHGPALRVNRSDEEVMEHRYVDQ